MFCALLRHYIDNDDWDLIQCPYIYVNTHASIYSFGCLLTRTNTTTLIVYLSVMKTVVNQSTNQLVAITFHIHRYLILTNWQQFLFIISQDHWLLFGPQTLCIIMQSLWINLFDPNLTKLSIYSMQNMFAISLILTKTPPHHIKDFIANEIWSQYVWLLVCRCLMGKCAINEDAVVFTLSCGGVLNLEILETDTTKEPQVHRRITISVRQNYFIWKIFQKFYYL